MARELIVFNFLIQSSSRDLDGCFWLSILFLLKIYKSNTIKFESFIIRDVVFFLSWFCHKKSDSLFQTFYTFLKNQIDEIEKKKLELAEIFKKNNSYR